MSFVSNFRTHLGKLSYFAWSCSYCKWLVLIWKKFRSHINHCPKYIRKCVAVLGVRVVDARAFYIHFAGVEHLLARLVSSFVTKYHSRLLSNCEHYERMIMIMELKLRSLCHTPTDFHTRTSQVHLSTADANRGKQRRNVSSCCFFRIFSLFRKCFWLCLKAFYSKALVLVEVFDHFAINDHVHRVCLITADHHQFSLINLHSGSSRESLAFSSWHFHPDKINHANERFWDNELNSIELN